MIHGNKIIRIAFILTASIVPGFIFSPGEAQIYKQEVEERIKEHDFPETALMVLRPFLGKTQKVKFYREQDMEQSGFECKFRKDKNWYSVEFTDEGILEDVETVISIEDLSEVTHKNILDYLDKKYQKYKITRLQKQFSADPDIKSPEQVINTALENKKNGMTIRFELELNGNYEGQPVSHELLFDKKGDFLRERVIINRQIDNILY